MSIQLFFDKYARNIRFWASAPIFFFIFCLGGCAGSTHTGPAPKVDKHPIKIPLKHRLAAIGLGPRKPKVALSIAPLTIGLALGGGAARGFAHIGVIQVLEENGIKPDLVVGTSAGALAASMYAMGKSGQAMQKIAEEMDESMMTDWTIPFFNRGGLLRGDAYTKFAGEQVGYQSIEQAQIPLGIVATDLNTGHGVLFRGGDIATAVRASSAVPGIFPPVTIDEIDYVDGGLTSPVPVRYARQMGATVVIAVDISAAPDGETSEGMLEILLKTFTIMAKSINDFELKNAEITVRPHLVGVGSSNFSAKRRAIEAGRLAMLAELPKLKALLL